MLNSWYLSWKTFEVSKFEKHLRVRLSAGFLHSLDFSDAPMGEHQSLGSTVNSVEGFNWAPILPVTTGE